MQVFEGKMSPKENLSIQITIVNITCRCCWKKTSHLQKRLTLQEMEKTCFTFNVSQWNQTFFQVILGCFFWSIHHEIYTQPKGQQTFSNYVKN